eukprot:237642-Prymnesium_polylepis.1
MRDNAAGATVTHQVGHGGDAGHGADSRVRCGNPLPTRRSCVDVPQARVGQICRKVSICRSNGLRCLAALRASEPSKMNAN